MRRQSPKVAPIICAAFAAQLCLGTAFAAVPVEESVEDSRRNEQAIEPAPRVAAPPRREAPPSLDIPPTIEPTVNTDYGSAAPVDQRSAPPVSAGAASGQGQLPELFYQLQVLQQELQDLRGLVEEQSYMVDRLQRDQKEQYLDLDRRVVALSQNQPAPGPSSSAPAVPTAPLPGADLTEREAYTQAFEAMRAREFDNSMAGFQNLIETYPNGQYTPNAYYWIGELYLVAKSDAELARQAFMQVVNLYPDHQKTPDALYKLGVVYHNLGDINSANTYLQRVQQEHPNSSAAALAARYAAEL
jgi:tol-pal system protein YbgF